MTGRKIFLAGGTGVLGRRVTPLLVSAGHDVMVNTRNEAAAANVRAAGATPVTVDLFDRPAVSAAVDGCDTVVNIATAIPTGGSAARKRNWATNDRIRTHASSHLASALPTGGTYVGESITIPYVDSGDQWIDESVARTFSSATESVNHAEAAARSVDGVSLRFAMFAANDSAHTRDLLAAARRGVFALPGNSDAYAPFIHIDDAASAVVAALDAPAGIYNIAEANPVQRSAHMEALAKALGRKRLRSLPSLVVKLGGPPVEALSRSQRISSGLFREVSNWVPAHSIVEEY